MEPTNDFPKLCDPQNGPHRRYEYIVTVAHNQVDFFSAGYTRSLGTEHVVSYTQLRVQNKISGENRFSLHF